MGAKWDFKRKKREKSRKLKRKSLYSPFLKGKKERKNVVSEYKNIELCQIYPYFKEETPILVRSLFIFRKPLCFPMCFLYRFLMFEKKLTGKGQRSYPRMTKFIT